MVYYIVVTFMYSAGKCTATSKGDPITCHRRKRELNGLGWSRPRPGRLTPGKEPGYPT